MDSPDFTSDQILYEDNHLLVINKRSSQIVQGDRTGDVPLPEQIKTFIKKRDNKPGNVYLGVAHRLDRPVSGVILFAKTDKALSRINKLIQERNFHKTYWAIVHDRPKKEADHLVHWLRKNEKQNKSYLHAEEKNGCVKAELKYRFLLSSDHYSLLEIELLTGRHHQIRAQLAEIGCPIKGDLKYGAARSNPDGSISLHARKLEFTHPVKNEPVSIIAAVPDEKLWQYFEKTVKP